MQKLGNIEKIGLAGAAMLTVLGVAIAANQNPEITVAAPEAPTTPVAAQNLAPAAQAFINDLAAVKFPYVGTEGASTDETWVEAGYSACKLFAQPNANREQAIEFIQGVLDKNTRELGVPYFSHNDTVAFVDAANSNLCPATVMPAVAPRIDIDVPRVRTPNLPNPPRVSSGGGGDGREGWFCRRKWWCLVASSITICWMAVARAMPRLTSRKTPCTSLNGDGMAQVQHVSMCLS